MKIMIMFFILFMSLNIWADEVKIELNPTKPVAGEVFQAHFRIFTDSDEEPQINFIPSSLEVVGKANQGISTRTVYANGKLTVTREITVVYELVSSKPGVSYIRDITVNLGGRTIRHPSVSVNILKEAEQLGDVFVMADVNKKNLFLGEGIVVRYFLYSKVPVSNLDVKKYPKLNNFLKRFLQEPERTERVSVDGQLYMRSQIYAAKLFPEKVGELKVDALHLSATYPSSRSGDPFGAFGLGRDFRTRTLQSETIKIQVRPLPEPVPTHFTGLVGPHDFQLQVGQSKLIVNEPLEVKLTASGVGALENLEAPELIKNPGLEEFETNGDLKITNAEQATKNFDYTYLAKENMNLPAKTVVLSYLDPNYEKYVTTQLQIPEIVVAGGVAGAAKKDSSLPDEKPQKVKSSNPKIELPKELALPVTVDSWQIRTWLPYMNFGLAGLAILLALTWFIRHKKWEGFQMKSDVPSEFKRGTFQYNTLTRWMTPVIQKTGKSPVGIIKESDLPEESKQYFIDLLSANDYKDYSTKKSSHQFKYQSSHFKRLARYIESAQHEDSPQS